MPFSPPSFAALCKYSDDLENTFSAITRRYRSSNLEELLSDVHSKMLDLKKYKPGSERRRNQLDVFRKLCNELKEIYKLNSEQKTNEAKMFLLGALIHRYLRIKMEYLRPDSQVLSLFGSKIENCDLYIQILKVLKISDENPLDDLTIQTCCQAFYDNMNDGNRYLEYVHFKSDPYFLQNIQTLIDKYKPRAAPILSQLKAIAFIQSVSVELRRINDLVKDAVQELFQVHLKGEDFNELTLDNILLKLSESGIHPFTKIRIEQLLLTKFVSTSIGNRDMDGLMDAMDQCLQAKSQYALFGAYMVIFQRSHSQDNLTKTLKMALWPDAMTKNDNIEPKICLYGLNILLSWMLDIKEDYNLDCKIWNNDPERLKAYIVEQKVPLMEGIENEQAQAQAQAQADRVTSTP